MENLNEASAKKILMKFAKNRKASSGRTSQVPEKTGHGRENFAIIR
jgi:hypothetical protein